MKEKLYRLDLAYIGTGFQGWQTQPEKNSIQDHLCHALSVVLRQEVGVIGSSRTDSGVHAEHQVATFQGPVTLNTRTFMRSINAILPQGIRIYRCGEVARDFHPIRSATAKLYRYTLGLHSAASPFIKDYIWSVYGLDVAKVIAVLPKFKGVHDFTSFCAKDSSAKTFHRNILQTYAYQEGDYLHVFILGEGFLKQMVRNIMGTLVDIGLGKLNTGDVARVFAAKNRSAAGRTAPAQGLSLIRVFYDPPPQDINLFLQQIPSFRFMV